MKYVIDSCTAFKWFLTEQESDEARLLRDSFRNQLADLIAPDIFPIEIVHALTRAERQKRITPLEGAELVEDLFQVLPILYTSLPLLPRAYEVSSRVRIGVYDCLYVALAEREGCSLVTTDQRLITNLPGSPIVSLRSL